MKLITSLLFSLLLLIGCSKDSETNIPSAENFDTQKMLSNITEQLILPKITNFNTLCTDLNSAVINYIATPNEANVVVMQTKWKEAASAYAQIYTFNIGEARVRFFHQALYNWPTLSIAIENFITDTNIITETNVSQLSPQVKTISGIEYMLFNDTPNQINQAFITTPKRLDYLKFIALSQKNKAADLYNLWNTNGENYSTSFINNSDTGLNASVNRLFNGLYNVVSTAKVTKVGKSAGLENSNNINLNELQARYSGYSKELIIENLKSVKEVFFNNQGLGLSNNISAITGNEQLNNSLQTKIDTAITSLTNLNGSLANSINNTPDDVRVIHEQLQEILIVLAVDIRSVLSIIITSTDNDGD